MDSSTQSTESPEMPCSPVQQINAAMTPDSDKQSSTKRCQEVSHPPGEAWEDWMDWNPTANPNQDRQLGSPPTTDGEDIMKKNEPPSPRVSNFVSSSNGPDPSSRKRKAGDILHSPTSLQPAQSDKLNAVKDRSHSIVEKRYRMNLNDKIAELRQSVPSLRQSSDSGHVQSSAAVLKHNKATILTKAIEYIQLLEKRNAYLEDANKTLRNRKPYETSAISDDRYTSVKEQMRSPASANHSSPTMSQASTTNTDEIRGLIPVPESFRKLRESVPAQPHYADQAPFEIPEEGTSSGNVSVRGGKTIGKLMIGSLAGMMIMDGMVGDRKEKGHDRGLFGLPLSTFPPFIQPVSMVIQVHWIIRGHHYFFIPFIKVFLVLAFLGGALFLYLFNSKPKPGSTDAIQPKGASPSSISSMEIRRNAWLTAIQTVGVPRHNVLPELLALILETHAYSARQLLGWQTYSWLTGRDEDDEIARVRAWDIAIDAQLLGGDSEMSRSRLLLTLWASGTLPKTPARLMLKALHVRLLFWQAFRHSRMNTTLDFVAKNLAHRQWSLGKDIIDNPTVSKDPIGHEPLPDHLVALLQRPIDEVMTNPTMQHAHDLAWNGVLLGNLKRDEGEVQTEETAILGSLDSLAASVSYVELQHALGAALETPETCISSVSQIELALRVAPPGSQSYIRALAATAILCDNDRKENIKKLSAVLKSSNDYSTQVSPSMSASLPDAMYANISVALECARLIESLSRSRHDPITVSKALQVASRLLSMTINLDMLALAAIYHLMSSISRQSSLARQDVAVFNGLIRDTLLQVNEAALQSISPHRMFPASFKVAMQRLTCSGHRGRRASNVSIDSGYGSICGQDLKA